MIKRLHVNQYRKIKDLDFDFAPDINAISGTNGTCKTSLLHLFSNSFQAVTKNCPWLINDKCLQIIKAVNSITNPKVESLTRGDRKYNDPAHGVRGILFTVDYYNREPLGFRRHNSTINSRYAVKPMYQPGTHDKLPYCPVIYLGLSRLVPFGEYQNDEAVSNIKKNLPDEYQQEISDIYKQFTHYAISSTNAQKMGDIKTRAEFSSDYDGIDSNTISAGEDNLHIILTALVSLKYYYESISSLNTIESVLLIDELDATLHPAFQINLLNLFRKFSKQYKIQIVFTTHSMSILENMLANHDNVTYLVDGITNITKMEELDIYKIKMHLSSLTHDDIYRDKVIPVFSEDDEARFLLDLLFSYFEETHSTEFLGVRRFFHIVQINLGAENLMNIFRDSKLLRTTMKSICVLDGDHNSEISNCIVALPGKIGGVSGSSMPPERLLFKYAEHLFNTDDPFWKNQIVISKGYSKHYYIDRIQTEIKRFEDSVSARTNTKKEREFNKELFNKERGFFEFLFKHWLHNPSNASEIEHFYSELRILFKKIAPYNEINPGEWK